MVTFVPSADKPDSAAVFANCSVAAVVGTTPNVDVLPVTLAVLKAPVTEAMPPVKLNVAFCA